MATNVTYKISAVRNCSTYVNEYWNDILIYRWRVAKPYQGGDIFEFLEKNSSYSYRIVNYNGIDEYHRRTFILDF